MNKRSTAIGVVIILFAVLLAFTQRGRLTFDPIPAKTAATPEEVIWRMTDAARQGDVQAFLDCFGGALRTNLEKTAAEMGPAKFRTYLQQLNAGVTGIAVSELEKSDDLQTAALRVEFVSPDKIEVQPHHFRFSAGQWRIERTGQYEP